MSTDPPVCAFLIPYLLIHMRIDVILIMEAFDCLNLV